MEGCHVIIFISQNPNPNFLLSFHHHGSRRRTSSPRRPPLHHHHTIAGDAPATTAPPICCNAHPTAATVTISILFRASTNAHPTCTPGSNYLPAVLSSVARSCRSTATPPQIVRFSPQFRQHCTSLESTFRFTTTASQTPFPQPPPQIERDERFHLAPPRTCTTEQHRRRRRRSLPPLPSRGREESVKVKP